MLLARSGLASQSNINDITAALNEPVNTASYDNYFYFTMSKIKIMPLVKFHLF
jgi:hypothetical protein